jgi:hypothetical protein
MNDDKLNSLAAQVQKLEDKTQHQAEHLEFLQKELESLREMIEEQSQH